MSTDRMLERGLGGLDEVDAVHRQLVVDANEVGEGSVAKVGAPLGHLRLAGKWRSIGCRKLGLVEHLLHVRFAAVDCGRDVDAPIKPLVEPRPIAEALADTKVIGIELSPSPVRLAINIIGLRRYLLTVLRLATLFLGGLTCRRTARPRKQTEQEEHPNKGMAGESRTHRVNRIESGGALEVGPRRQPAGR